MTSYASVQRFRDTMAALAPIRGYIIRFLGVTGNVDTASVAFVFEATATQQQKDAANAARLAFDWSDAAQQAWEDAQDPDFVTIRNSAAAAIQSNNTYLAIVSPTNADRFTQLDALTRQNTQIIKAVGALIVRLTGR